MSLLKNLPIELIRRIVLNLEHPSDLLHIALTCKFFHEMIIVTRHLHLTHISCSDLDTPPKFWRMLCAKPYYASMIRHLELRNAPFLHWPQFHGCRIDEKFVEDLTSDSLLPVSAELSPQELLLKSLDYMDGLKYIGIHMQGAEPTELYDCLRHVSKNLSNSLEVLHVIDFPRHSNFSPQYQPSDFSFRYLTSFSLLTPLEHSVSHPLVLLLDSLASNCHTLVNCALQLSQPFPIFDLVKKAEWPSLRRLTFMGTIQLTDDEMTREENINSYLSFFARHSKLERLRVSLAHEDARQFADELFPRLHGLLPSLRSLHWSGHIPLDIICRLESIDRTLIPLDHCHLAQSLRSCVIGSIDYGELQAMMEVMPRQLERFSVFINNEPPVGHPEYFEAILEELPKVLSPLINLTHLEIRFELCLQDLQCSPEAFIDYLPCLTYFQFSTPYNMDGWVHVTVDDSSFPYTRRFDSLEESTDKSYESKYWGDFFMGGP